MGMASNIVEDIQGKPLQWYSHVVTREFPSCDAMDIKRQELCLNSLSGTYNLEIEEQAEVNIFFTRIMLLTNKEFGLLQKSSLKL